MSDNRQYALPLTQPEKRALSMMGPHEMFAAANELLVDRLIENAVLEKKSGRVKGTVLSEYFSMWANTPPFGGCIIVGVEDDGKKTGLVAVGSNQVTEIELAGPNLCPDARYEQKNIKVTNNKGQPDYILLFYVRYNSERVVENHKREAFIRRGNQKHRLRDYEKAELRIDRGEIDLEDEFCGLSYPDDFRSDEIDGFATAITDSLPGVSARTAEEVLILRRLGKLQSGRFRPNNACALLFAKDPLTRFPGCKIRFLRFDGDVEGTGARFNATKDMWFEGTVPEIIVTARAAIRTQIREYTRLGIDGKFFTGPEYPEDAWFEAIVNACVHRSYNMRNTTVFVKMFDSRLEIESPGGFPPGVTPENIFNHSVPRNRRLFEAMFYLKYVLCAHEGTRRMRDMMQSFSLPAPRFTQSDLDTITFKVTLENNIAFRKQYVDSRAVEVVGVERFILLNDKERLTVNFTAEHGKITVSDATRVVRGAWKHVKAILEGLCDKDIMVRVSPMGVERDPKAHYVLKHANRD